MNYVGAMKKLRPSEDGYVKCRLLFTRANMPDEFIHFVITFPVVECLPELYIDSPCRRSKWRN